MNAPSDAAFALPRPGRALKGVLITLLAVWLVLALAVNWGNADPELFYLLCGNTALILHGQLWRLFTAPFVHLVSGSLGHILSALIGLYFLGPSLESVWGGKRFLRFLGLSALFAYGSQMLIELLVPATVASKLVPFHWFGAMPVVSAVSIAWALSFRGQTVRLFMVLPVTGSGLVWFTIAFNVLALVALQQSACGRIAPFGGMLAGWLLGGGTPSPLRAWWLRRRLRDLDQRVAAGAAADARARSERVARSGLRVIQGGKDDDDEDDEAPSGRYLN